VLQLLPRSDVELGELVSLVEVDPALTMTMLQLANTASSSPGRRIGTARAAVIRLGALTTKRALAGAVMSGAFPEVDGAVIDLDEYWRHSLATALIGDAIAMRSGERTEAFTAGLLHDMGCLAMAASEPVRYERVTQLVRQGVGEEDAERVMFGFDHAYYGMRLAGRWDLSQTITDAIGDHHSGSANDIASATAKARAVAERAGIGDGRTKSPSVEPKLAPADHAILLGLHGVQGLNALIDSYGEAVGMRAKPILSAAGAGPKNAFGSPDPGLVASA
jgi:HD-like signal output (HDOD) protein